MTKIRSQLYLEERQKKALEDRRRLTGKSIGQLVREAVEEVYLKPRPVEEPIPEDDPFWEYIGAGESQESDISAQHDLYLYRAGA